MEIPDVFNEGEEGAVREAENGSTEANENLQNHLRVNTDAYSEEQLKTYQKQLNVLENKAETAQAELSRAKATQDLRKKWLDSKDNKDFQKQLAKVAGGIKELKGSFTLDSLKSPSEISREQNCPEGLKECARRSKKGLGRRHRKKDVWN